MKKEKGSFVFPKYDTKGFIKALILGVFIGLAVIVPGISGSTVAIMFGLYAALLYSIGNIFGDFKRCFKFLVPIGIGVVAGFAAGFLLVQLLLEKYMFIVICLFVGLMIGASPALINELRGEKANVKRVVLMIFGLAIPIAIGALSVYLDPPKLMADVSEGISQAFTEFPPYLFIAYIPLGALVAATQLIPGLSATAILMAFGQFKPIMDSVHLDHILENPMFILLMLCMVGGFAAGLVIISKIFSKLIEKHRGTTFFFVIGLSFGSIVSMFINPDIAQVYYDWGHIGFKGGEFAVGIVLLVIGFVLSWLVTRYELKHSKTEQNNENQIETDKESKENE